MVNIKIKIRNNWRNILLLSILFVIILVTQFVLREVIVFRNDLESFESELYELEKLAVKRDVENRVLEIETMYDSNQQDLRDHLQSNLSGLYFAIEMLLIEMDSATLEEKEDAIIRIVQQYNINDTLHTYFINNVEGYHILSGLSNEEVYEYTLDYKDILNRYFVQDQLDGVLASETGDAFVTYYYPKEIGGEPFLKTSYLQLIEELGLIIGTGAYQVDYNLSIQNRLIDMYTEYYKESDNYVYILSGDGNVIFHINEAFIGENISSNNDPVLQVALEAIYRKIDESNGGFVQYTFYEDSISGLESKRTAYVVYVAEFDYIVGSSFNDDKHDELINDYINDSYQKAMLYYLPFLMLLMLTAFFIYFYIKKNVKDSMSIFREEEDLYRKFANLTSEMIVITEKAGEILFINTIGERIIGSRESDSKTYNLNQILGEEDGFYVLRGVDKNFFVRFNREKIMFNMEECELYFISDVTDKVNTEKKLENLVQLDELTNLGNRRKMIKDFNEIINPYTKTTGKTAFLVMLDIDNFKPVNDQFGHIYGDEVLRSISVLLTDISNEDVMVYRVGGDEFAVLIKGLQEKDVYKMFQTLNKQIKRYQWTKPIDISFSGGIVLVKSKDKYRRLNDYIDKADKKLYNAKVSGKMKVN
ncbi:MAG: cache domain-containing protein [Candidatus Izemoplasma sp.]